MTHAHDRDVNLMLPESLKREGAKERKGHLQIDNADTKDSSVSACNLRQCYRAPVWLIEIGWPLYLKMHRNVAIANVLL